MVIELKKSADMSEKGKRVWPYLVKFISVL